ncbi:MAG: PAS domain-containing protein [Acidimicrobiia bacterium]|nr:PAS domain-containing protein [Acidimicrobiia bacterium]
MGDADDVEEVEPEPGPDPALEALLKYLRDSRGFDFSGYKRASVGRRIAKRMQAVGADTYADYQEFLEAQPVEFAELFNTILINVTAFNRDPEAWKFLAEEVAPRLVETKGDDDPIRTWSAGCSSGEETYSLAVVLCDVVGEEEFRRRVKVYGTDADEEALTIARHGRYPAKAVSDAFTEEQRDRYFEPDNADLVFRKDLRRSVIFGRHDLVQDAPISRVDLLVCRNTLMYFNADTQQRVLTNFQFALNEGGYLFLGKSEALVRRLGLFEPVDIKRHVFGKRTGANRTRPSLPPMAPAVPRAPRPYDLADLSFENAAVAQIVVDRTGMLVLANRHARTLFGLGLNQVGRPFKDLELSYRPVELRSRIDQVLHERRPSTVNEVQLSLPGGGTEFLDVYLMPLTSDSQATAVALTFLEVGRYKVLGEELERSQRELEAAYEELQSINEELETTNEELQSTNEELETTNEELHSTNEELETMNEELQSTNEELETTNNELRQRSIELDDVNAFLESILGSLGSGVIVLSRQFTVRVWNKISEELWGLRADEVAGQQFFGLDIGLPVDELSQPIRSALTNPDGSSEVQVAAVNRRGRALECNVRISPLKGDGQAADGVILLVDG